ncbi:MAG: alkaline phosphatase [Nitrospirales bacterium]|nr:alkaline phosphatase [Nitrospirales bacterium]
MKHYLRRLIVSATAAVVLALTLGPATASEQPHSLGDLLGIHGKAKNIIFMVPDGMGLADVTAARIRKNGVSGDPLHMETLEQIGYQRTYAANNTITDSAAAASAWACGEKFNNGEICFHADGSLSNPTILELARKRGKAAGLVATSTITHATPAVFGAHVVSRGCEKEIARQYIEVTMPEVILGGGVSKFRSATPDSCGTSGDFIAEAMGLGYSVAYTKEEMTSAVSAGSRKILGLFNQSGLTPEYQRQAGTTEPRLPEMAASALEILEKDRDGFFLMVEGSQIDWANHANDLEYQIGETLAFDEAVKVVKDWINEKPLRKQNTLLIIVADHETGGFSVNGPEEGGELGVFQAGWTSIGHTGVDTMIWSQGPGSEKLGSALDNTDVYGIMKEVLR